MSWIRRLIGFDAKGVDTQFAKRLTLYNAYRRVFMGADGEITADGKLVLADLIDKAGLIQGQINLVTGELSTNHMLVREGKREIVHGLMRRLFIRPIRMDKKTAEAEEMSQLDTYITTLQRELTSL